MNDDPSDTPPIRTLNADGTMHFTDLKKLSLSGTQYLHSVNHPSEPTTDMRIGTITHFMLLGPRPGAKELVKYDGRRAGKDWEAFAARNDDKEIVNASEWRLGAQMAESVRRSPVAMRRLHGAHTEIPMRWEESGMPCSTSGVDIFCVDRALGDLKSTTTTNPELFKTQAFKMAYPQQLAWYRRGARANGLVVGGLFILGVERKAPFEVVELDLTEALIDLAEQSLSKWLEKLRGYRLSIPEPKTVYDWPGYAQAPIAWDAPAWASDDEDEDDLDEEDAA